MFGRNAFDTLKTSRRIDRRAKNPAQIIDIEFGKRAAAVSIFDNRANQAQKANFLSRKIECFQALAHLSNATPKNVPITHFRQLSIPALLL